MVALLSASSVLCPANKNSVWNNENARTLQAGTMTGMIDGFVNVTAAQAKAMIDVDPYLVVLDVRNYSEYVTGHIRNAELIPLYELSARLTGLNKSAPILVYCEPGGRSMAASWILESNGFVHVFNVLGGITDWISLRYPVYVNYASIQEAVNNATDGETIRVASGTYQEHVHINKPVSLIGENIDTTTVDGTSNGTVFEVSADNVSISDFTITDSGCGCKGFCAIHAENHQNINVTDNYIFSDGYGVKLDSATRVVVTNNTMTRNTQAPISILASTGILVSQNDVENNDDGIEVDASTDNAFYGNLLLDTMNGITLTESTNNTVWGNTIGNNSFFGLSLIRSGDNLFFDNNFLANAVQAATSTDSSNFWDNGFEGNFWSNYAGVDTRHVGTGDTPQIMNSKNMDNHPLMGAFHVFTTLSGYGVSIVSNSTINQFNCSSLGGPVELIVSNTTADQTAGFCRVSIPHALINPINGSIQVIIDNGRTPVTFINTTLYDNGTNRWIYFSYPQSSHQIAISPEFSPQLILPLLLALAASVSATATRRRTPPRKQ